MPWPISISMMVTLFSMKELEKDMTLLRSGMKECGREVEFYRGQTLTSGVRYLPVMREFMTTAQVRLTELEDLFTDMKARVGENILIGVYLILFHFCPFHHRHSI